PDQWRRDMPDTDAASASKLAWLRILLWAVALTAGVASLIYYGSKNSKPDSTSSSYASAFGGAFELVAPDGAKVTDQSLAGKPYAIFFGFTRCPDVCPTSLARMARLRKSLEADGLKFNIVFVSVDPEHDKPADIGSYVELFGTPIIGLTGSQAQLAKIKKGFGVYVKRVPMDPAKPNGDYTIDHTAAIYLMSAKGEFVSTIDHAEADTVALEKLKRIIG
ncbi:MAG: SCO family protein, partial [Sphingorhabdus sp.]